MLKLSSEVALLSGHNRNIFLWFNCYLSLWVTTVSNRSYAATVDIFERSLYMIVFIIFDSYYLLHSIVKNHENDHLIISLNCRKFYSWGLCLWSLWHAPILSNLFFCVGRIFAAQCIPSGIIKEYLHFLLSKSRCQIALYARMASAASAVSVCWEYVVRLDSRISTAENVNNIFYSSTRDALRVKVLIYLQLCYLHCHCDWNGAIIRMPPAIQRLLHFALHFLDSE